MHGLYSHDVRTVSVLETARYLGDVCQLQCGSSSVAGIGKHSKRALLMRMECPCRTVADIQQCSKAQHQRHCNEHVCQLLCVDVGVLRQITPSCPPATPRRPAHVVMYLTSCATSVECCMFVCLFASLNYMPHEQSWGLKGRPRCCWCCALLTTEEADESMLPSYPPVHDVLP